jgi:heat-inducible transcriptional repressor
MLSDFNQRTRDIFRLIVDEFLETGDPTGSRTLSRRLSTSLSSATIRNVMSDLENAGLIYSPHISAGRLPTEMGLRLYVDGIMQIGNLSSEDRTKIESECKASGQSVTDIYEKTGSLLSGLSSCLSVVISPKFNKPIKQIQFLPLETHRILVIMVLQDGIVENRIMSVPEPVDRSILEQASNYLNQRLVGKTISEARDDIMFDIRNHKSNLNTLTAHLIEQGLIVAVDTSAGGNIIVRGQSHLLSDVNEMANLEQARDILTLLEEEENMLKILDLVSSGEGVQIFIGSENRMFDGGAWSTIFSPYRDDTGRTIGAVGVIGPTRLNYARIVPIVDFTSQIMAKLIGSATLEKI